MRIAKVYQTTERSVKTLGRSSEQFDPDPSITPDAFIPLNLFAPTKFFWIPGRWIVMN